MKGFVFVAVVLFCGLAFAKDISEECLRGITDRFECCKNAEQNVNLTNPADCSTFYQCANNRPVLKNCSEGLHWSIKHNECRKPEEAKCTENTCPGGRCVFAVQLKLRTFSAPIVTDNCEPEPACHRCLSGFYPPEICCQLYKSYYKLRLADQKDPKSYYQCVDEKPWHRQCPEGLQWSVVSDRCEFPSECKHIQFNDDGSIFDNGKVRARRCGTGEVSYECYAGFADKDLCCSEAGPFSSLYFQNNEDCQTYYQCVNGAGLKRNCDNNLYWSIDEKKCVVKEKSTCGK